MKKKHHCAHTFSIISPVYNVEPYLNDFFRSLTEQSADFTKNIELICVDDGSEDASAAVIARWQEKFPNITYHQKKNGGRASARNLGLSLAKGDWVTFIDPDDFVENTYFQEVDNFLQAPKSGNVSMVCCRQLFYSDHTHSSMDRHHLRHQFQHGPRWIPADKCGQFVEAANSSVFYRRKILIKNNIKNKEDIKPYFEDSEMNIFYILSLKNASIGILPEAIYYHRVRVGILNFIDCMKEYKEFYNDIFDNGYIRTLKTVKKTIGYIPEFVQRLVLTSLLAQVSFFSSSNGAQHYQRFSTVEALRKRIAETFYLLNSTPLPTDMAQSVPDYLWRFVETTPSRSIREHIWITASKYDAYKRQIKLSYSAPGTMEEGRVKDDLLFFQGATHIVPAWKKLRSRAFLEQTIPPEYICWLPLKDLATPLKVDGCSVRFELKGKDVGTSLSPAKAVELLMPHAQGHEVQEKPEQINKYLLTTGEDSQHCGSWIFMDVHTQADDNAEHLYWHVVKNHPEIRAYYVLSPESPHWPRMVSQGAALLAHGTEEHIRALSHCGNLISSHTHIKDEADALLAFRGLSSSYAFIFLQHGYIKSDLSASFNKDLDCFVTGTRGELHSIAGDGNAYPYTGKEVVLTGFPRTDALLNGKTTPERLIMVMPTWRSFLPAKLDYEGTFSKSQLSAIKNSVYFTSWKHFFHSPKTKDLLARYDYRMLFWPHKMIRSYLPLFALPDFVEVPDFSSAPSIQSAFKRTAIFLTDYTSAAFDCALLHRTIIYYQFDSGTFFSGMHNMAIKNYFDYERDGFGPVVYSEHELHDALRKAMQNNGNIEKQYRERIDATFPFQDTNNCQRVFEAICDLHSPVPRTQCQGKI